MELQGKKFVLSYSGGKDSILALYRAVQMGMEPCGLLTTYNIDMGRSWFHGIPEEVLQAVSDSLGLPVTLIRTSGDAYRDNFLRLLKAKKAEGVEACVFGDIDIAGHLEWCTELCRDAGIEAVFLLWQQPRAQLVRELIDLGFVANITVVDTSRLGEKHLGMVLSEEVLASIVEDGADVCGENGEYHSFVSDGPLFSAPVSFAFGEKLRREPFVVLPLLPA